jgi:hypothetical protein
MGGYAVPLSCMPQQVIGNGFSDCESLRISFAATAAPIAAPFLEDADGRYVLVDRAEPVQALKVVVNHALGADPYESFFGTTVGTITTQSYDPVADSIETDIQPTSTLAFAQGVYKRYEDVTTTDTTSTGGSSTTTNRHVYRDRRRTDYDDDWNPVEVVYESFAFAMPMSFQSQTPIGVGTLNDSSSYSGHSLRTPDARSIDFETGEVSDAWSIVVYEVYEWGDSELTRFNFDTDPQATARCNGEELCDNGCIEFVINEDGAYTCLCPEEYDLPDLGPPRPDPDADLEVHPKEQLHRKREPLKQTRRKLAKTEADYRDTLDKIGQKEQAVNDAISQGNQSAEAAAKKELEELIDKGKKQASDYQNAKLDNERDSIIEKDLVNPEKTSDTTVVPTADGSRYPRFTSGTIRPTIITPTINRGITITPTVNRRVITPTINAGITITPTVNSTTITPTINAGITITPTINRGVTIRPTVNGVAIGGALPTSDSSGIDL